MKLGLDFTTTWECAGVHMIGTAILLGQARVLLDASV